MRHVFNAKIAIASGILLTSAFTSFALLQPATAQAQSLAATVESLDAVWPQRDKSIKEIDGFVKSEPAIPDSYDVAWRMARLVTYAGNYGPLKSMTDSEKVKLFTYGYGAADKAIKLNPKGVEGHYYFATNYGSYGLAKGITEALGGAKRMREELETVIKIDPKFDHGGGSRVLGRMYFKLPGWPLSFGDNAKSADLLKKAIEIDGTFKLNFIYMAQTATKTENKEAAVKYLEKAKSLPFTSEVGVLEDQEYNEQIEELLKKYR